MNVITGNNVVSIISTVIFDEKHNCFYKIPNCILDQVDAVRFIQPGLVVYAVAQRGPMRTWKVCLCVDAKRFDEGRLVVLPKEYTVLGDAVKDMEIL